LTVKDESEFQIQH